MILTSFLCIYVARRPIMYFTGIGTPFCFTHAISQGVKDSVLVFYTAGLTYYINGSKYDSLERRYGFCHTSGNGEVSQMVLDMYNKPIMTELRKRLGKHRWNNYLHAQDSISKLASHMLPQKKKHNLYP